MFLFVHLLLLLFLLRDSLAVIEEYSFEGNRLSTEENDMLQASCGRPPSASRSFATLYGLPIHLTESPWSVSLNLAVKWHPAADEDTVENSLVPLCSGTLVSPRHVLTAAHCIGVNTADCKRKKPLTLSQGHLSRWRVYMGGRCSNPKHCREQHKEEQLVGRRVVKAYFPPYYTQGKCGDNSLVGGDMAILELESDVPFSRDVYPACLTSKNVSLGSVVSATGFGKDSGQDGSILPDVGVLKTSQQVVADCQREVSRDFFCTFAMFHSPCSGDSGGGVVETELVGGRTAIVGAMSMASHCPVMADKFEKDDLYTMSLHTAVWDHRDWICLTTGICREHEIAEKVSRYLSEPQSSRPVLALQVGPIPYEEMFI